MRRLQHPAEQRRGGRADGPARPLPHRAAHRHGRARVREPSGRQGPPEGARRARAPRVTDLSENQEEVQELNQARLDSALLAV